MDLKDSFNNNKNSFNEDTTPSESGFFTAFGKLLDSIVVFAWLFTIGFCLYRLYSNIPLGDTLIYNTIVLFFLVSIAYTRKIKK